MEQPELILHPQQQATLTNAISSIFSKQEENEPMDAKFIIETHSEEIVAKFSELIFKGELNHSDVQVVMFNVQPDRPPINSIIHICKFQKKNGELKD